MPLTRSMLLFAVALALAALLGGPAASPAAEQGRFVIDDDGHDLRASASAKAASLGGVSRGEIVTVLSRQGGFSNVRTEDGRTGWVPDKVVRGEAAYLADPRNRELVLCPKEMVRTFPLKPTGHEGAATLVLRDVPSLLGGDAQAALTDASGKALWQGPTQGAGGDPTVFFCRDFGFYWPQAAGDLDGDGRIEILAQDPQSDVSVSSYTLIRFSRELVPSVAFSGRGLVETPLGSGRFLWTDPDFPSQNVRWIMNVATVAADGTMTVPVYEYAGLAGSELRTGTAKVRLEADGAVLVSWVKPLAKPAD
ncbi:SH3 domain-containing protein [Desulfovibrio sulfodismutans]|uniref:SH3 domain-containing protein n=1 Tax=Desulfolutivibrio sulfodismutans TaxID=63561 RepID=A0A7K3NRC4_9BACT|nr:SH3 domain-containing protein [Desulfolutivibrio sulfodismutans]NDY58746.1 SH3 domain-containing protein [Desulfolutivibrio sulfodismutans]QLA12747.1 SH3 domain-containing protein [Desulfolutivibrio sulfodismutans DSM 3696]